MDIIKRNFFRILRSGAFNEYEPIEPMSVFKWKKLFKMIILQDVIYTAISGIKNNQFDKTNTIPQFLIKELFHNYNTNENYILDQYSELPSYTLCNKLLNKRLIKIRHNEIHAIDTSTETLELLNIIICNINTILTSGISYNRIIYLGRHLRNKGDKVDFIKLENWLKSLHIQYMAQFIGSILITTLNFEHDEVPFVQHLDFTAYKRSLRTLNDEPLYNNNEWHFRQGRSGLLHNNAVLLRNNIWHKIKYLNYAPIETISNFIQNITNSLAEIEE